ncbi:MAG: carbon-nitrogen hydrolase family protein [Planctomycetota bacterium]|jgi:predicted amidohydrolase
MLTQSRREFLKTVAAAGIGASAVLAQTKNGSGRRGKKNAQTKAQTKKTVSKIRVAQIKVYPDKGRIDANHIKLMNTLGTIEKNHEVDVVVTPEGFLDGYVATEKSVTKDGMVRYAIDPQTSRYTPAVSDWARRNRAWIIYGCARKAADGVYNTALIYNRRGRLVGMYDKLHLQRHDQKYTPGKHLNVYKSDFGLFGVMICADRRWPETARTLTLQGARVIFNPTYGMHGDLNLCMMRTRAYENGIFIVFTHPGQSLITGPDGAVVCNNEDKGQTYTVTEIDLSKAPADTSGHIIDRRTDVYKL